MFLLMVSASAESVGVLELSGLERAKFILNKFNIQQFSGVLAGADYEAAI